MDLFVIDRIVIAFISKLISSSALLFYVMVGVSAFVDVILQSKNKRKGKKQ